MHLYVTAQCSLIDKIIFNEIFQQVYKIIGMRKKGGAEKN